MKRVYKILLFLSITVFVFITLFTIGRINYPAYGIQKKRIKKILANKDQVRALVVGASHGIAIRPEYLGFENGVNLCDGGTDLFEIDYKLRSLLPRLPNVDTIIISISYFSFSYDNAVYQHPKNGGHTRSEKRREVYATYPSFRWIKGDIGNFFAGKLYPLVTEDHWEKVFNHASELVAAVDILRKQKTAPKLYNTPAALDQHGRRRAKSEYANHIHNMKKNHSELEKHTNSLMNHLVRYLKEKDIRTIFVISPFWRSYIDSFPDYYKDLLTDNLSFLINTYDIEIYNFSESAYFQNRPELFHNSDHLHKNSYGIFCRLLKKAMDRRYSGLAVIHGFDSIPDELSQNGK